MPKRFNRFLFICVIALAFDPYAAMLSETMVTAPDHYSVESCFEVLTGPKVTSLNSLDSEIKLHPHSASSYVRRGAAYLMAGDVESADQDFRKALIIDPRCAPAHIGISRICQCARNYKEAFMQLDLAILVGTPSLCVNARWESAFLHRELKQYALAIKEFDEVLKSNLLSNTSKAYVYFHRGEAFARTNNYKAAVQDYSRALTLVPSFPLAHRIRGRAYVSLNQFDSALKDYSMVVAQDSDASPQLIIDTLKDRASLYKRMGKIELADKDYSMSRKYEEQALDAVPFRER